MTQIKDLVVKSLKADFLTQIADLSRKKTEFFYEDY